MQRLVSVSYCWYWLFNRYFLSVGFLTDFKILATKTDHNRLTIDQSVSFGFGFHRIIVSSSIGSPLAFRITCFQCHLQIYKAKSNFFAIPDVKVRFRQTQILFFYVQTNCQNLNFEWTQMHAKISTKTQILFLHVC